MSIIKVDNLIFDYNRISDDGTEIKQRAIDGVSLEIEAGSFVAIVGQNGSGKSTLAKCLNGLLVPSEGDVTVFDMNTRDDNTIWDLRSRIAMVFQNPDNQIVNSIVEDDVAFGPENLGVDPLEIRQRVESALKEVGMYELRNKGAHMLSGGQKQRVAIAGAVAMKPDCIVFDEPTAMLDPLGRSQVMKIIKELNEQGITIVLITHFMQEAFRADRIVVMKEGKIFCDKTPAELFGNEELIMGAGLEMPPAVDLRMRLVQRGVQIPNDIMTQEALVDYICR